MTSALHPYYRLAVAERKRADQRTSDLLVAAERVLTRNNGVTVAEVAREAGIASGTFYLYFPSKAHLEATLVDQVAADYVARVQAEAARIGDPFERLDLVLGSIVGFAFEHKAIFRLHVNQSPTPGGAEVRAQAVHHLRSLLRSTLLAGASEGAFQLDDPDMTAAVLYHGLEGTLRHAISHDHDVRADALVQTARRLARRALSR